MEFDLWENANICFEICEVLWNLHCLARCMFYICCLNVSEMNKKPYSSSFFELVKIKTWPLSPT